MTLPHLSRLALLTAEAEVAALRAPEHSGMFGPCCGGPRPTSLAEHRSQETAWRYHWGWINGRLYGGPSPASAAPDYRRGWDDAIG